MAASTRASTGNSKPRTLKDLAVNVIPTTTRTRNNTTKPTRKTKTSTKANTSRPRMSKVRTGRVAKPAADKKTDKTKKETAVEKVVTVKKPRTKTGKAVDQVAGGVERLIGDVTGRPGKKPAGTAKARGTDRAAQRSSPRSKKL